MEIRPIARIHTDFPEKFGIPRQSNLVKEARGIIVFEPEFSQPECVRGIEGYDYLWLVWGFDHGEKSTWSPTVRPPILGGNKRMGVFATRSPFRPNPLAPSFTCWVPTCATAPKFTTSSPMFPRRIATRMCAEALLPKTSGTVCAWKYPMTCSVFSIPTSWKRSRKCSRLTRAPQRTMIRNARTLWHSRTGTCISQSMTRRAL